MIKICPSCGVEYDGTPRKIYCDACAAERIRTQHREFERRKRERIAAANAVDGGDQHREFERRKREQISPQRSKNPRICSICGASIDNRGAAAKYCVPCAKKMAVQASVASAKRAYKENSREILAKRKAWREKNGINYYRRKMDRMRPEEQKAWRRSEAQKTAARLSPEGLAMLKAQKADAGRRWYAAQHYKTEWYQEDDIPSVLSIRHASGLSQADFAAKHSIPQVELSQWEADEKPCSTWIRRLLAGAEKLIPPPEPIPRPNCTPSSVRELREQLGLSRPAFGARHGISYWTIRDWETGKTRCPPFALPLLLEIEAMATARNTEED